MARIRELTVYIVALITILLFGIVGTFYIGSHGGFNVHISSLIDAAYFTIVTLSTI